MGQGTTEPPPLSRSSLLRSARSSTSSSEALARAVYLFGSRAEGRARPDSDFDLLVIFDDSVPDELITHEAAYTPVCGSGIGCDVVPCHASELQEVLHDPTNPWQEAWRNARILYERR